MADNNDLKLSRLIEMNRLNNTRDLGGMEAAEGSIIRPGKLYRSGQLFFADEADVEKLNNLDLRIIYDFRSSKERDEKPDPVLKGVSNVHRPIVRDIVAGISRDKKSDGQAFDMVIESIRKDPDFGTRYMADTYTKMVSDAYAVEGYAQFIRSVAESDNGAVLWHCTAGKDRAGFAAVLLEEILGVRKDAIIADYMSTNAYLEEEIETIVRMLGEKMDIKGAEDAVKNFFGAKEEYITILYEYTAEKYGGMDCFIKEALGVDDKVKGRLRELYLV